MAVLNLRNVPEDLMRQLRSQAALAGRGNHFHEYCIGLLEVAVAQLAGERTRKLPPIDLKILSGLKDSLSKTPEWAHPGSRPEKEILQNRAQNIPEIIPEPPSDEPLETRIT
jgi:hypothetical protein